MAYSAPTIVHIGAPTKIVSAVTTTGATTPFSFDKGSGNYWGQATFQQVPTSLTVLTADLEVDISGVDANFVAFISGINLFANPIQIFNLTGGTDIRYRWNIKTITGTSTDIWAAIG